MGGDNADRRSQKTVCRIWVCWNLAFVFDTGNIDCQFVEVGDIDCDTAMGQIL